MSSDFDNSQNQETVQNLLRGGGIGATILVGIAGLCGLAIWVFMFCRIEVPSRTIAVLTRKTGAELKNIDEIVTKENTDKFKGIEEKVLTEGRYFYNPWKWDWDIVEQVEVPENRLGDLGCDACRRRTDCADVRQHRCRGRESDRAAKRKHLPQ